MQKKSVMEFHILYKLCEGVHADKRVIKNIKMSYFCSIDKKNYKDENTNENIKKKVLKLINVVVNEKTNMEKCNIDYLSL